MRCWWILAPFRLGNTSPYTWSPLPACILHFVISCMHDPDFSKNSVYVMKKVTSHRLFGKLVLQGFRFRYWLTPYSTIDWSPAEFFVGKSSVVSASLQLPGCQRTVEECADSVLCETFPVGRHGSGLTSRALCRIMWHSSSCETHTCIMWHSMVMWVAVTLTTSMLEHHLTD